MQQPTKLLRLTASDLGLMRALNALFAQSFADQQTYLGAPPSDAYLKGLLSKDDVFAIVAEASGEVRAGLVAYQLEKFEQARSEIYIYDLAVAAPYRRQGLATALIGNLQQIAAARGAWVIFVQADYGDEAAISLYEGLGTREEVLHFDIQPSPTTSE
jgi:aminoglycoside 3-N-acetyltransferase I